MDMQTLILVLSSILGLNRAFIFDMEVKLDSALQPGGALSRNKGAYLYDSFRTEVLTPAFQAILAELKSNHRSDVVTESVLGMTLILLLVLILILWIKLKKNIKTLNVKKDVPKPKV